MCKILPVKRNESQNKVIHVGPNINAEQNNNIDTYSKFNLIWTVLWVTFEKRR